MNRAPIVRRGVNSRGVNSRGGKAGGKARFAQGIDVPLPKLFQPSAAGVRQHAELFNLKLKPGYYNAEAQVALLRREKKGPHDELWVDFSRDHVRVELVASGQLLVAGDWSWGATVDGQNIAAAGKWSEVCWHREDACDYLEIELPLAGGWKIERQMLLARADRFLLIADSLLGPGTAGDIQYQHGLPLAPAVVCQATQDTREVVLKASGRARSVVAPLACGEWRAELSDGGLTAEDGQLVQRAGARGRRLYAPLWIDLDPRRLARPMTWRRLSVGENLAICQPDVAVGYRVQAGKEQWVVYRSLTEFGNRSVLGHNTAYSFVCGRVKKNGELEAVLEIE